MLQVLTRTVYLCVPFYLCSLTVFLSPLSPLTHEPPHTHTPHTTLIIITYPKMILLIFLMYLLSSGITAVVQPMELPKDCICICVWRFKQIHFLPLLPCHRLKQFCSCFLASSYSEKWVFLIILRTLWKMLIETMQSFFFLIMVFQHQSFSLGIKFLNSFSRIGEKQNFITKFEFH